mmetsp:Transcript_22316/g.51097  ORF Transcript_22316/g.51097 Transcript_22316/m.51097 type:complete len:423 (+) Transcript_22316:62-1330(+)
MAQTGIMPAPHPLFEAPVPVQVKNTFIDMGGVDDIEDMLFNGGINTRRQYSEPVRGTSALNDAPTPLLRYSTFIGLSKPAVTEGFAEGDLEDELESTMEVQNVSCNNAVNCEDPVMGMGGYPQEARWDGTVYSAPMLAFAMDCSGSFAPVEQQQSIQKPMQAAGGVGLPAEWANVTTVMMRHLSNQYTQRILLEEIGQTGFANKFDFLYLPIDPQTGRNKGYSFINFVDPSTAWSFRLSFDGRKMNRFNCSKVVSVTPAALQGFDANYAHYSTTRVTRGDPAARPLFLRQPTNATPQVQRRRGGRARRGGRGSAIDQAVAARQREQDTRKMGSSNDGDEYDDDDLAASLADYEKSDVLPAPAPALVQQPQTQRSRGGGTGGAPESSAAGTVRPKFCTSCGTPVKPTYNFCEGCGVALKPVAA